VERSGLLLLALGISTLLACPSPPEQTGVVPNNQGPDGQGQPFMENGANSPGQGPSGTENNVPAGDGQTVVDTAGLPNFQALIDSGAETVTISGQVEGITNGFVDFQVAHTQGGWVVPKIVHQGLVVDGTFSVQAPQEYTVELYLVVVDGIDSVDGVGEEEGRTMTPGDTRIYYPEPVTIGTEDISLEFSADSTASWEGVFTALPDLEDGTPVLDGPPEGADLNPVPVNPAPDGAEDSPGGMGTPHQLGHLPSSDVPAHLGGQGGDQVDPNTGPNGTEGSSGGE
jgi:hypothetical protein